MKRFSTNTTAMPSGPVGKAFEEVSASFERFCLAAGVETLSAMLEKDAEEVCGPRHARGEGRRGHRWGRTRGKIGFHGGKVELERPRVRDFDGQELPLPSWERRGGLAWSVGDEPDADQRVDAEVSSSGATSGRRRSGSAGCGRVEIGDLAPLRGVISGAHEGMDGVGLGHLDIMVVQIDGIHIAEDIVLVAAIGIDGEGAKHPLGLIEGASEHSAVVQALIDNLIERGLDPAVPRLFIIDGSKALSKAVRRSFGRHTPIQRCQIHKARNIMERLPKPLHASDRAVRDCRSRAIVQPRCPVTGPFVARPGEIAPGAGLVDQADRRSSLERSVSTAAEQPPGARSGEAGRLHHARLPHP
jgi:putative transposase